MMHGVINTFQPNGTSICVTRGSENTHTFFFSASKHTRLFQNVTKQHNLWLIHRYILRCAVLCISNNHSDTKNWVRSLSVVVHELFTTTFAQIKRTKYLVSLIPFLNQLTSSDIYTSASRYQGNNQSSTILLLLGESNCKCRGYPAKRALPAILTLGREGPFGRIPPIYAPLMLRSQCVVYWWLMSI